MESENAVGTELDELQLVKAWEERYLMPSYARNPILLVRGKGPFVFDHTGKRYLDFITGIGVNALGHSHPAIVRTMREQCGRLMHSSNLYYNEFQGRLAQRLTGLSGMERAFFTVSGAEAAEGALKIARRLGQEKSPDKTEFVALNRSFHGRTVGALSVTGQPEYRTPFGPLLEGVHFIEGNDEDALAAAVGPRTCGIIVEPVQGEGGVYELSAAFLAAAARLAREHGATLIFDEIQCGLGRTGKWFAHQWTDVVPDIVITAKPIAAGYPLGAILARGAAATALNVGSHGTTFGGGPLACRLGLEVLDVIERDNLLERVRERGRELREGVESVASRYKFVRAVRGKGLILGVELDRPAAPAVRHMAELGLLANVTHDTVIRMLPPYIVEPPHIARAIRILAKGLAKLRKA